MSTFILHLKIFQTEMVMIQITMAVKVLFILLFCLILILSEQKYRDLSISLEKYFRVTESNNLCTCIKINVG